MKKVFIPLFFIVLIPFFALSSAFAYKSGGICSWGLSGLREGKIPTPPANGAKMLAENNGIFLGNTNEKKIYFTFDLGYEPGYTAKVLDILKENDIKAVFFICGAYLKEKDLLDRMISEGHAIGNHTDKHRDLPSLSDEGIRKDINTLSENFKNLYGDVPLKYFRPPQGRFCERTLKAANEAGMKTVMWSIAIVDWSKTPIDAAACAKTISSRLHPGAVLLLHITNSGTPEMLRLLLPVMKEKGYSAGHWNEL